jgi:nucleotide-binding universal stress UspA family protein
MPLDQTTLKSALADFRLARQRAALESIAARFTGKSTRLLSYEEVYRRLRPTGAAGHGLRLIPLNAIVGSVGRYTDFSRTFLPRRDSDEQRWAKLKVAIEEQGLDAFPPIEVYQIGEAYFVKDGNHRVSIARQMGLLDILAEVTEVRTRVPLSPDAGPDDIILKAEYAAFLEYTRLDESRPDADLTVSAPGQYSKLEDHIEVHRYFREAEQKRDVPFEEAACLWHDEVYLPIVQAIREKGILRDFARRTEADLYLWLSENRIALQRELGWQIGSEEIPARLLTQFRPQPRAVRTILDAVLPDALKSAPPAGQWQAEKLIDRYSDRLFVDILAPIGPAATGWSALDQALALARREGAQLRGLHVVATESDAHGDQARAIQAEFKRRCEAAGVRGSLGVEAGSITQQICKRAVMADIVVLDLAHPPGNSPIARLGSKWQAILRRSPRPVLAVPGAASPLERALLAYNGSSKAHEALFVAAYLAERWKIALVVLSVVEPGRVGPEVVEHARRYLEMHEVQAHFAQAHGRAADAILKTAGEHACDLLLLGSYGARTVRGILLGGTIDQVLRESKLPALICP